MKLVLKSPVPEGEGEEDLAAIAVNRDPAVCETKGCRNLRQPFFFVLHDQLS